jgi:hypothetical protein
LSHTLLSIANATDEFAPIFTTYPKQYDTDKDGVGSAVIEMVGGRRYPIFSKLSKPYAIYHWELSYHELMHVTDSRLWSGKFDLALEVCHLVFNPYAGTERKQIWRWGPFADANTVNVLKDIFNKLQLHTPNDLDVPINAWRDKPFDPHVIARTRPVAYMKRPMMVYLRILIAYGDWYFRQTSLEAVPMALQYYTLASHIYGFKTQRIPKRGKEKLQTYFSLLDQ